MVTEEQIEHLVVEISKKLNVLDGRASLRLPAQTLLAANWVLNEVSGLYEYIFENEKITFSTEVEIIPHPQSLQAVVSAGIQPFTPVANGQVTIFAQNQPLEDITVNILIQKVQDAV